MKRGKIVNFLGKGYPGVKTSVGQAIEFGLVKFQAWLNLTSLSKHYFDNFSSERLNQQS